MKNSTQIGLIGGGPLGIEIAVALKRAGLPYLHFEAAQIGATMQWWAPGTRWFSSNERISIAGVPLMTANQEKASREEYLAYLRSIVAQFDLDIHTYTRIIGIERTSEGFTLHARKNVGGQNIGSEHTFHVDKLILSTGGTERPNLLNVPGEDLPHVSHYFHDPHTYFRRELLIVGGRNSAVEAALRCYRAGAKVSVAYRGDAIDSKDIKYWLYPEFASLVKAGRIPGYFNTVVREITPTHVTLQQLDGQARQVAADFVLLMTGYLADMSLATMAGVETSGDQQIPAYNAQTMETNVPGLYIAGTAIAGTQKRYRIFLENCVNIHPSRILAHFKEQGLIAKMPEGFTVDVEREKPSLPES